VRGAVIEAPRRVRVEEQPDPLPGPGQVRVRIEGCGVCASNLPTWEGRPWFRYPSAPGAPGHEGWGTVDALGEGASGVALGDRVAMLSYNAYADCDVAQAEQLVKLPPELAGKPFPGEALACAMNIFARSRIEPGQDVAIVGIGFLGAILTKLAADAGARVIGISRRAFALETAERFGAAHVLPLAERGEVGRAVRRLTQGRGCARVIEAVGYQDALDVASELVADRGCLIIAGYHQDSPRQVDMQQWNWRGIDVVNAHERDPRVYVHGMRAAIEHVLAGRLDLNALCTHAFPLHRLGDALEAVRTRAQGLLKAWVTP
jgi:threonine dehydrogenase-like Zn-dependent dehydrogenase